MLVVEKYAMSRRTIALGRKRKLGCFLGAIVLAIIFASCTSSVPLAPDWFDNCSEEKDTTVYGCGSGKSKEEARLNAQADLRINMHNTAQKIAKKFAQEFTILEECETIRYAARPDKIHTSCEPYTLSKITIRQNFRDLKYHINGDTHYMKLEWDMAPLIQESAPR